MSGPWEKYASPAPPVGDGPWARYGQKQLPPGVLPEGTLDGVGPVSSAQPATEEPTYSGGILPFSRFKDGSVRFDSNAGVVGAVKRAFTLPGDVAAGKVAVRGEDGRLTDEAIERATEMAGVVSPAAATARIPGAGIKAVREPVPPPSAEALKQAADAGYSSAREMGVVYSSDGVKRVADTIAANLEKDGVIAELAPKSFGVLGRLQKPPAGSVATIEGVEAARRAFGNAGKAFDNPTDQMAAARARTGLDRFLENPDPTDVVAGPAAAAGKTLAEARGNHAAAARSNTLQGIDEATGLRTDAANSGLNLDNTLRGRVASALLQPKAIAGFNDAERAALEQVVRGSPARNAARNIGNALGGGGGILASLYGLGGAGLTASGASPTAGLLVAGAPLLGYGARRVANAMAERSLHKADVMVRQRSPLYEQMLAEAPLTVGSVEKKMAVIRALAGAQAQQ